MTAAQVPSFQRNMAAIAVNDVHRLAMFMAYRPEHMLHRRATVRFTADSDEQLRELIEEMYDFWKWDGEDAVAYLDFGIGARIEIDCRACIDHAEAVVLAHRSPW